MLRKAWLNGSVPADLNELAYLCRVNPRTMRKVWPQLAPMWIGMDGNSSRIISKKLESERKFLEDKRKFAQDSANARWKHKKINESDDATALLYSNASPPHPIPSHPVSTNVDTRKKKAAAIEDTRREPLKTALFCEFHARRETDLITDPSDWKAFENLLRATRIAPIMTGDEIQRRWILFLSSDRPFHRQQGHPLRWFCQNINAFAEYRPNGGNNGNGPDDPNTRATKDYFNRRMASSVQPGIPDVRKNS